MLPVKVFKEREKRGGEEETGKQTDRLTETKRKRQRQRRGKTVSGLVFKTSKSTSSHTVPFKKAAPPNHSNIS